jgi:hypothetical protein
LGSNAVASVSLEDPAQPDIIAFGDYRLDPLSVFMEKELT